MSRSNIDKEVKNLIFFETQQIYIHDSCCVCFSCSLWFKYALLKGDATLMAVNSAGGLLNLSFIAIYYAYTMQKVMMALQLA